MTPRISPHGQSPHTTIDYLAALTQSRISSGYLRIPCPAHGGTNPNLALWVNDDGIAARCHSAGCSYADIAKAIEDRYGISINPRRYHDNPTALAPRPTNARRTPGPGPNAQDRKKGADSGVDGYINFFDDNSGKAKRIIVQVKSGHVTRDQIATLKGDMDREEAEIGLFITLETPTRPMEAEATSAGFYTPEHFPDNHYPRIQILTIEELLSGARADYPRLAPDTTFRRAPRRRRSAGAQSRFAE